jgi:hypothetical protein
VAALLKKGSATCASQQTHDPRNYISVLKILWRNAIDRSRNIKQGRT